MGRWIRRHFDLRLGRPRCLRPISLRKKKKPSNKKSFGASGLRIGAPQKRRSNDNRSKAPFLGLWKMRPEPRNGTWLEWEPVGTGPAQHLQEQARICNREVQFDFIFTSRLYSSFRIQLVTGSGRMVFQDLFQLHGQEVNQIHKSYLHSRLNIHLLLSATTCLGAPTSCDFCDCHIVDRRNRGAPRHDNALPHRDLRARWRIAHDMRFRTAMSSWGLRAKNHSSVTRKRGYN